MNQPQGARPKAQEDPGRVCPVAYRYSPKVFDREPQVVTDTLYIVGGLYGNVEALDALHRLVAEHPGAVVFNGDFHWFDIDPADCARVTREVLAHAAIRGNVETELAAEDSGAGCGCAYPMDVSDAEVQRSNAILERLRETARALPGMRETLGALPMHLTAQVGDARIGIVHGDASSLAGWGFAHDQLDKPAHARWLQSMFAQGNVDAFASTHTCLPAMRRFDFGSGARVIANNGAAGTPNYAGTRHGLITRIATRPLGGAASLEATEVAGAHVELLRLDYDHDAWVRRFLAQWPEGSPAHASYYRRIVEGPRFTPGRIAA